MAPPPCSPKTSAGRKVQGLAAVALTSEATAGAGDGRLGEGGVAAGFCVARHTTRRSAHLVGKRPQSGFPRPSQPLDGRVYGRRGPIPSVSAAVFRCEGFSRCWSSRGAGSGRGCQTTCSRGAVGGRLPLRGLGSRPGQDRGGGNRPRGGGQKPSSLAVRSTPEMRSRRAGKRMDSPDGIGSRAQQRRGGGDGRRASRTYQRLNGAGSEMMAMGVPEGRRAPGRGHGRWGGTARCCARD